MHSTREMREMRGVWMIFSWFEMKPMFGLRVKIATGLHTSQHKKANNRKGDYREQWRRGKRKLKMRITWRTV